MSTTDRLDESSIEQFSERIRGAVLRPDDEGYDEARSVWNGMVDRYPAAVVRCAGAADVMAAVDFARERDLPLAVKGGGHNVAGKAVCDDGLVVDLSPMDGVRVDPGARTARVGAGATWADVDHETQAFGLATTGGLDSRTGVAGLTLGGGIGYLARPYGLSCDNLLAADVVTARGELVTASEEENPELFWGLRGGGGNFGVVTAFEFELHEVGPEVGTAQVFYPAEQATEVLRSYREFVTDAPDEVACYAMVLHVPPEPPFPEARRGETTVGLVACHAGDVEAGVAALEPLETFGDPIVSAVQPMPYTALQRNFDDGAPAGERYYYKAHYLEALPDGAIETVVQETDPLKGPFTIVGLEPMGGAVNRVDPTATAFPHRDAAYSFGVWTGWSDPDRDDEMIEWTRTVHERMAPYSTGGVYANYLDRDEDERVTAAYRENYERLAELKTEWDPENRFRLNQNVEPAG